MSNTKKNKILKSNRFTKKQLIKTFQLPAWNLKSIPLPVLPAVLRTYSRCLSLSVFEVWCPPLNSYDDYNDDDDGGSNVDGNEE